MNEELFKKYFPNLNIENVDDLLYEYNKYIESFCSILGISSLLLEQKLMLLSLILEIRFEGVYSERMMNSKR